MNEAGRQFAIFALVGALGTSVHYALMIGLVELAAVVPVHASVAGFVAGAIVNYLANHIVTFNRSRPHRHAIPRFFSIAFAGAIVNTAVMAVCIRMGLHYVLSQVLATGLVVILTFVGNSLWTYGGSADRASGQRI